MKNYKTILLHQTSTIKETLKIIDKGAIQIALVVDSQNILLGTVTDGDIRRAILNGLSLDDTIKNIYFKKPIVANVNCTKDEIIDICQTKKIFQIPIVDDSGKIVGIEIFNELIKSSRYSNRVVLMVGGLGTRLRPLTNDIPKPMLHVGNKPILETIIANFKKNGFYNFTLCLGYKAEIIKEHFKDGTQFGVNIEYIVENKRLGTAGALSLIQKSIEEPFFVMNGDLLTNVNFEDLLKFHIENRAKASMCVRAYDFQVPYGVVGIENENIKSITEKPIHKFFVSAGIYMLDPACIGLIPKNEFYDMPTLFEKLIELGEKTISFPLREYWLDIGRIEEYEKANSEYGKVF